MLIEIISIKDVNTIQYSHLFVTVYVLIPITNVVKMETHA